MALSQQAYKDASNAFDCEIAVVKAVAEVESSGHGFLPCGIPVILFEAHWFAKLTGHAYNKSHPDISSRIWNRKLYATGKDWIDRGRKEAQRLEKASSLNRDAALQSASYGMFQVMGFNWKLCGYKSLQAFINDVWSSEDGQLRAFVGFVKGKKLEKYLREKDWDAFASKYNGEGYKQNRYDEKLQAAYLKHSRG